MVKIIGKDSGIRFCTCSECSNILEYTTAELQRDYDLFYIDHVGAQVFFEFITCPECNKSCKLGFSGHELTGYSINPQLGLPI